MKQFRLDFLNAGVCCAAICLVAVGCGGGDGEDAFDSTVTADSIHETTDQDSVDSGHVPDVSVETTDSGAGLDASGPDADGQNVDTADAADTPDAASLDATDTADASDPGDAEAQDPDVPQLDVNDDGYIPLAEACALRACGPDQTGSGSCGFCTEDDAVCKDGMCEGPGCYRASAFYCMDSFYSDSEPVSDDMSFRSFCESTGGQWTVCPTENRLLSVLNRGGSGGGSRTTWYLGRFCSADEALAYEQRIMDADGYPEETLDVISRNDELVCEGEVVADSFSCEVTTTDGHYCIAFIGEIQAERAAALSAHCTDSRGGVVVESCPPMEKGMCEYPPLGDTSSNVPREQELYYSGLLGSYSSVCSGHGGRFSWADCSSDVVVYGSCELAVQYCDHDRTIYSDANYEVIVVDPDILPEGSMAGYASSDESREVAYDAALADLATREDLTAKCLACNPACDAVGEFCQSGTCIQYGCIDQYGDKCVDGIALTGTATVDWTAEKSACLADGGTWEQCPTEGELLGVRIPRDGGGTVVEHYYLGLFCDVDEAMSSVDDHVADPLSVEIVSLNDGLACSEPTSDGIGCLRLSDDICEMIYGPLEPERRAAFIKYCENRGLGSMAVSGCPGKDLAVCELQFPWNTSIPWLVYYYSSADMLPAEASCGESDGNWIETDCATSVVYHGTCKLQQEYCHHPAGQVQAEYYEMWLTELTPPDGSRTQVYVDNQPDLAAAYAAALEKLSEYVDYAADCGVSG